MSKTNAVTLTKKNYDAVKEAADRRGVNVYALVNALIKDVGVADGEEKVILCVPSHLTKENKDGLFDWLQASVDKIVDSYYPDKVESVCP